MISGNLLWISGLALAWGTQLTLGHFQIQMWTAGLVILSSLLHIRMAGKGKYRMIWRTAFLCGGLFWGLLIAWVQLRLTWELTKVAGFERPPEALAIYSFPPANWAQFALPEVFLGVHQGIADNYLARQKNNLRGSLRLCWYCGLDLGFRRRLWQGLGSRILQALAGPCSLVSCLGNNARLVARWFPSADEATGSRLVSRSGSIHAAYQLGPGPASRKRV